MVQEGGSSFKGNRETLEEDPTSPAVMEVQELLLPSDVSLLGLCEEEEEKGKPEPSTPKHPGVLPPAGRRQQAASLPWAPTQHVPEAPSLPAGHSISLCPRKKRGYSQLCATKVIASRRPSPLTFYAHGFPHALPRQLSPAMPPIPVPIPSSVASRVHVPVQVLDVPLEVLGYFVHAIRLRVYGAAAEAQTAALAGPPLVGDTRGGYRAPGGTAPLTVSSRTVKYPGGQRLQAEETE